MDSSSLHDAPGDSIDSAGVRDRLALLIFKAGVTVLAAAESELQALGLSGRDYTGLAILATDRPDSQQELARLMGKGPQLVVAMIDELEAKGFVERVRSPEDRRRTVVRMTAKGRRVLARADVLAERIELEVLGGIDPSGRSELHALLRRALAVD